MTITVGDAIVYFRGDTRPLKQDTAKAERMTRSWAGGLGRSVSTMVGNVMAGAFTVVAGALAGVGREVLELGGDFEEQMAILTIAAAGSGESLDVLHDAAMTVGGDTDLLGVSASGAAESMTGLYKAGLTTNEMFGDLQGYLAGTTELGGALRASIDLAAATELDMVQASDLAAITLATFGGELETEAERAEFINIAMNNFVQAADASVAEVSDLADAMKNLGPTAAAFGFSLQDTNNALAILSTRGIAGSEAGTALKSMLTNMMRTTPKVTAAMDKLGISLYDQEGQMRELPDIMGQFQTALAGMTEEERNNYVQTIAGTYGMKAMQTLLASGTQGWNDMATATASAATIQEQAAAKAGTFKGQMEALDGTIETIKIGLMEALLPALTQLATGFSEFVSEHGPAIAAGFASMVAALQPFVDLVLSLLSGETSFADLLPPEVLTVFEAFQGFLDRMGAWWAEHGPTIQEVAGSMFAKFQEVSADLTQNVLAWLVEKLDLLGTWFEENGPLIEAFAVVVGQAFEFIWQKVGEAWSFVQPLLDGIIALALDLATTIMQMATGDWAGAWDTISQAVLDFDVALRETITAAFDWVLSWFGTSMEELSALWSEKWEAIKLFFSEIWTAITTYLTEQWDLIKGIIDEALAFLDTLIGDEMRAIADAWSEIWTEILDFVSDVWEQKIQPKIDDALAELKKVWDDATALLGDVWEAAWEAISTVFSTIWTKIKEKIDKAIEKAKGAFNSVDWGAIGRAIISGIASGIAEKAKKVADKARRAVKDAIQAARDAMGIQSPSRVAAREVGEPIGQGVGVGLERAMEQVQVQFNAGLAGLIPAMGGLGGTTSNAQTVYIDTLVLQGVGSGRSLLAELMALE